MCALKRSQDQSRSDQHIYGRLKLHPSESSLEQELQQSPSHQVSLCQSYDQLSCKIAGTADTLPKDCSASVPSSKRRSALGKRLKLLRSFGVSKEQQAISHLLAEKPLIDQRNPLYLDESVCQWMSALRSQSHSYCNLDGVSDFDFVLCNIKSIPGRNCQYLTQQRQNEAISTADAAPAYQKLFPAQLTNWANRQTTVTTHSESHSKKLWNTEPNDNEEAVILRPVQVQQHTQAPTAAAAVDLESKHLQPTTVAEMLQEFKQNLMSANSNNNNNNISTAAAVLQAECAEPKTATSLPGMQALSSIAEHKAKRQGIYLKLDEQQQQQQQQQQNQNNAALNEMNNNYNNKLNEHADHKVNNEQVSSSNCTAAENQQAVALSALRADHLLSRCADFQANTARLATASKRCGIYQPEQCESPDYLLVTVASQCPSSINIQRSAKANAAVISSRTAGPCNSEFGWLTSFYQLNFDSHQWFNTILIGCSLNNIVIAYEPSLRAFLKRIAQHPLHARRSPQQLLRKYLRFVKFCGKHSALSSANCTSESVLRHNGGSRNSRQHLQPLQKTETPAANKKTATSAEKTNNCQCCKPNDKTCNAKQRITEIGQCDIRECVCVCDSSENNLSILAKTAASEIDKAQQKSCQLEKASDSASVTNSFSCNENLSLITLRQCANENSNCLSLASNAAVTEAAVCNNRWAIADNKLLNISSRQKFNTWEKPQNWQSNFMPSDSENHWDIDDDKILNINPRQRQKAARSAADVTVLSGSSNSLPLSAQQKSPIPLENFSQTSIKVCKSAEQDKLPLSSKQPANYQPENSKENCMENPLSAEASKLDQQAKQKRILKTQNLRAPQVPHRDPKTVLTASANQAKTMTVKASQETDLNDNMMQQQQPAKNLSKANNNNKGEESIYQPIWQFKTVGEVQERYCTDADYFELPTAAESQTRHDSCSESAASSAASSPSISSLLSETGISSNNNNSNKPVICITPEDEVMLEEDHGEWETDDEFMFATPQQPNSTQPNKKNYIGEDTCSLHSNMSKSSISASGSTVTGFGSSTATLASALSGSLMHHLFRNIGIFYSLSEPKLRAIIYDYDRVHAWQYFAKSSESLSLSSASSSPKLSDPSKISAEANVALVSAPLPKHSARTGATPNAKTSVTPPAALKPLRRAPPPPSSGESAKTKPSIAAATNKLATTPAAAATKLCDSVQAWKCMLLSVHYLEDEEDMIVSQAEILRSQEIKEDINVSSQLNISQRFKSASIGNLIDLPNDDDKKSIAERMRNKLQRGVFKLNARSPKSEKKSRSIFRRAEATSLYLEEGLSPKYPIFNASLDQLELNFTSYPHVPRFVVDCVTYIERKDCIEQDGLYRASGNKISIDELKAKLTQSYIYDFKLLVIDDIHTLTSLLKLFFRELAAPLIPQETYERLPANLYGESALNVMQEAFAEMKEPNRSTLKFLIKHLTNVAAQSSANRMPASNLAIVWGPCILSVNQIEFDIGRMNTLAKVLIENYERIFNENERLVC